MIPGISYIPGTTAYARRSRITENAKKLFEFVEERIKEHQLTFDPDNIRDFIDAYLNEIRVQEEKGVKNTTFTSKT